MGYCTVGIADLQISKLPGDILITHALGSCIGMTVYDPVKKIGGMIHYMLPLAKTSPEKAVERPAMFADTGVPLLLEKVIAAGAGKFNLITKVAGGAKLFDDNGFFNIGERNFQALRKILWKSNVLIKAHHVGGSMSRTMRLCIDTGQVFVKAAGTEFEL